MEIIATNKGQAPVSQSIKRICIQFYSLFFILLFVGCEGGKNNGACDPSSPSCENYTPSNRCPTGQQLVNGVCQTSKPSCPEGLVKKGDQCVAPCPIGQHLEQDKCLKDGINIEIINTHACKADNGYQQIILQFIARDDNGFAIDPELNAQNQPTVLSSEILIDGSPADNESLISRDSKLLKSDMVLSLVLDSSGSMLQHKPPAFTPMKAAATSILSKTKSKWQDNESNFEWRVLWFNDYLYKPDESIQEWTVEDVSQIPAPSLAAGTELYKAINHMLGIHKTLYKSEVASKERDQHVMIVLSDGKDNHSHTSDNKNFLEQKNLDGALYWTQFGSGAVDKQGLISSIANTVAPTSTDSVPNLRIHVIGLGENANTDDNELEAIATAGNGLYFDSSSSAIDKVFEDVQREFITIQTIGIKTSLVGTHSFSIRASHNVTLAEGTSNEAYTLDTSREQLANCQ